MRVGVWHEGERTEIQLTMSPDEANSYSAMIGSALRGDLNAFEREALKELGDRLFLSVDQATLNRV